MPTGPMCRNAPLQIGPSRPRFQHMAQDILDRVERYYSGKIAEFGPVAKGVDWKDEAGQKLRFEMLARLFDGTTGPSVLQIGCGYGGFLDFCDDEGLTPTYTGYDISEKMIEAARARNMHRENVRFELGSVPSEKADYAISSGIFNVKFDVPTERWKAYVLETIDTLANSANKGFAFNCLTGHSDEHRKVDRLYYPMPGEMLDYCVRRYGRKVSILHDYDLYEFTVMVTK